VKCILRVSVNADSFVFCQGQSSGQGRQFCLLASSTQRERTCLNVGGIRHDSVSSCLLSIVNEGAAINELSVVSQRKGALLNMVWAGEDFFKNLGAGVNKGC
jgi:hypothetical protein